MIKIDTSPILYFSPPGEDTHRHRMPMAQWGQLLDERNRPWFADPTRYGHREVFGEGRQRSSRLDHG